MTFIFGKREVEFDKMQRRFSLGGGHYFTERVYYGGISLSIELNVPFLRFAHKQTTPTMFYVEVISNLQANVSTRKPHAWHNCIIHRNSLSER